MFPHRVIVKSRNVKHHYGTKDKSSEGTYPLKFDMIHNNPKNPQYDDEPNIIPDQILNPGRTS